MVKKLFLLLPGPTPLRIGLAAIIVVAAFVGLMFFYDWLGSTFLDTGGSIG